MLDQEFTACSSTCIQFIFETIGFVISAYFIIFVISLPCLMLFSMFLLTVL